MAIADTLAYYDAATITAVKGFIVLVPGDIISLNTIQKLSGYISLLCTNAKKSYRP
jgi:hypothetical protein